MEIKFIDFPFVIEIIETYIYIYIIKRIKTTAKRNSIKPKIKTLKIHFPINFDESIGSLD